MTGWRVPWVEIGRAPERNNSSVVVINAEARRAEMEPRMRVLRPGLDSARPMVNLQLLLDRGHPLAHPRVFCRSVRE